MELRRVRGREDQGIFATRRETEDWNGRRAERHGGEERPREGYRARWADREDDRVTSDYRERMGERREEGPRNRRSDGQQDGGRQCGDRDLRKFIERKRERSRSSSSSSWDCREEGGKRRKTSAPERWEDREQRRSGTVHRRSQSGKVKESKRIAVEQTTDKEVKDIKTDPKVIFVKPKKKVTFASSDVVIFGDSSQEQSEEEEIDQPVEALLQNPTLMPDDADQSMAVAEVEESTLTYECSVSKQEESDNNLSLENSIVDIISFLQLKHCTGAEIQDDLKSDTLTAEKNDENTSISASGDTIATTVDDENDVKTNENTNIAASEYSESTTVEKAADVKYIAEDAVETYFDNTSEVDAMDTTEAKGNAESNQINENGSNATAQEIPVKEEILIQEEAQKEVEATRKVETSSRTEELHLVYDASNEAIPYSEMVTKKKDIKPEMSVVTNQIQELTRRRDNMTLNLEDLKVIPSVMFLRRI